MRMECQQQNCNERKMLTFDFVKTMCDLNTVAILHDKGDTLLHYVQSAIVLLVAHFGKHQEHVLDLGHCVCVLRE